MVVGHDSSEIGDITSLIGRATATAILLAVLLVLLGTYIFRRELARRVSHIRQTTQQIGAGQLSKRISASTGEDEFTLLNRDVNAMLDRIELLMKSARHIEDTGALTSKRMETIDDETVGAALDYIDKHGKGDKPFFVWMNTTRMHIYTHIRPEHQGKSGMPGNDYADGMWEHDQDVGKLLKKLDDLGIADNTIVVYTTDNGPNQFSWPDAATTPFRNEKDSNWEGAFRVPAMVRWPGHIPAGVTRNGMVSGLDWFPTLLAAAGEGDIKEKLLKGWAAGNGGKNYKVHLDGYNQLEYLTGKSDKSARNDFYYFNDDGLLVAMRMENWKIVFCEQRAPGGFDVWKDPFVCLRVPKVFNLRMDPYERADIVSDQYYDWLSKNAYLAFIGSAKASEFLETFVEWPPSQRPASFSVDQVQEEVDRKIMQYFEEQKKKQGK
ncbi:HAMP domain protein [Bordetella bronchiseptica 980-2]|nr:HAMP domain protein [Bordetella bronchiseptica 980-2]